MMKQFLSVAAVMAVLVFLAAAPATTPVEPMRNGIILLHAQDATVHGNQARYEPQPFKNTVGYWTKKEDWVSWDFVVQKPGNYHVVVYQGCGKGSGGSEVEFAVGDQKLKMTVEETGHFQNFKERFIGTIPLTAGPHTLTVKPQTKPGAAVMDLHEVELLPEETHPAGAAH